jgi:hypothetical protein
MVEVKEVIQPDKLWGIQNMPWEDFLCGMQFLAPQAYGSRIEKRIIKENKLEKVSSAKGLGDFIDSMGDYWEVKVSLVTHADSKIDIVQIRPWQQVKYMLVAFDLFNKPNTSYVFHLSKADMERELKLLKATSAHGTKQANKGNANVEYRFSLNPTPTDEHFSRWCKNYLSNYKPI